MKKEDINKAIKTIKNYHSDGNQNAEIDELINNANIIIDSYRKLHKEKEKQKREHQKIAFKDSLCGICNRRRFGQMLKNEINRAKRYKTKFSIIMFDLDKFKLINDSFGHETGDVVLKKTAHIVEKNIRSTDVLARWGGDEFIILLPRTENKDAAMLAEKLRTNLSSVDIDDCPQVTGSFGVAEYIPGDSPKEVIVRADISLYRAKNSGRNKVYYNLDEKYLAEDKLTLTKVSLPKEIRHLKHLTYAIDIIENENSLHNLVVAGYAEGIAKAAGIEETKVLADIKTSALLHDVGKIGIPFKIISKKTKLTDEERQIVQKHSELSAVITRNILNNDDIYEIILSHHERYDGTGYPRGLKGDEIPFGSRILTIADTFHVILFGRIYQEAVSIDNAVKEIEKYSGSQFDPKYVKAFKSWVQNSFMAKI